MKKVFLSIYILLFALLCLWTGKCVMELRRENQAEQIPAAVIQMAETEAPVEETAEMPTEVPTEEPTEAPTEAPTEEPTEATAPAEYVYSFTQEEEDLLLKLGMAERGEIGCVECIALVMRTVLNRVEGPKFSSSIRGVIYTENQFTPVEEGTLQSAQPNDACYEALELIKTGWDESQGALYYEWCEGESWHSRSLNLLMQHCDTRFYN